MNAKQYLRDLQMAGYRPNTPLSERVVAHAYGIRQSVPSFAAHLAAYDERQPLPVNRKGETDVPLQAGPGARRRSRRIRRLRSRAARVRAEPSLT
jgi:hypothetical protein